MSNFYKDDYSLKSSGYKYIELGALNMHRMCVVILCGGQGTRLGHNGPKGTFILCENSGYTLYEIMLRKIKNIEVKYKCNIRIIFMTSEYTNDITISYINNISKTLKINSKIEYVMQQSVHCLDENGNKIKISPTEYALSPNGNGGVFKALYNIDMDGIEYVNITAVDNVLANILDPLAIGYAISNDIYILSKGITQEENRGEFYRSKDNKGDIRVIEYSENNKCTDNYLPTGIANICDHYFKKEFIKKIHNIKLPVHLAHKKIPYYDDSRGEIIHPKEPNGYKQELFIFDAFNFTTKNEILVVPRALEFSPLKNSHDKDKDNKYTCIKDIIRRNKIVNNMLL